MDARTSVFSVAEAKARFSELLSRAEGGEEIVINRHGRPVAKLSAAMREQKQEQSFDKRQKAWDDWFAYRDEQGISLPAGMTVKDLIEDGRRF